jgi:glyoxylase-like metal-dependent hydrolase (beta-lactamase superfamily II)
MKVSPHIHLLKIPFKIPISADLQIDRFVNIFIVEGDQICLVDTGVAGSEKIIFEYLEKIGRKPEDIKHVLLTHTHPDHMGALKTIKEHTGCKVYVHAAEKKWLENSAQQFSDRPVPGFQTLVAGSCNADYLVEDEQVLNLGRDLVFKTIHCPGHSAGSVAYLHQQDNALFTGDIIPVRYDIPIYDDYQQSLKSLEKIENMPFPEHLYSSLDADRHEDEVEEIISAGFEILYEVHAAFLDVYRNFPETELAGITKAVLEKLNLPSKFINPLFMRGLKSHFNALTRR